MANTGTVTVKIAGDASHLQKTLVDVEQSLGSKLGSIGDKMQAVGKKMTTHLTLPIVGGLALAVKAFGDFEQQLNTFKAVSGATAEEMTRISQLAKDLGADIALPGTSAKDAADAMTELAKAGLSVNDTMAASKAVLQLSAAAQIGNAEAATMTATALNSFGLKGTDAIKVADLLAATANASSAEIVDVGMALSQASAVFSASKVPIEDLSTAIGLMANNGIRGSDAGTSLKSAMLALQTPSNKQSLIMTKIGFSLYDATGKMKSMREIIGNLESSFKGMTQQQRDTNLGILLGSDGIRAGNILLKEGVIGWDKLKVEVTKSGAAGEVAAAKMKGVKGALEALKSNVETLAISVGEKLAPFMVKLSGMLNDVVDKLSTLSPAMQKIIFIVALVVAAIGPLIMVLGYVISAVGTVTTVLEFLAANPVVLIIAAVVALVAALVYAYFHFEAFRNVVDGVAKFLADRIGPAIKAFIDYIIEQFGNAVAWVQAFWPQISEAIGHVMTVIRETVQVILGVLAALWRAWGDDILNVVKTAWNYVRETIENAVQVIKGIFQVIIAVINGDWGKAWDGVKTIVGAVWDQIGNIISTAIGVIKGILGGLASTVVEMARGLWEPIKEGFKSVINWIIRGWNGLDFKMPDFDTHIPGIGKVGGFTIGMPDIQPLALGGIVTRPTLSMIGEAGPEAVIPLSRMSGGGTSTTTRNYTINVTAIDPASAQEAVMRAIKEFERRNGANWRN